MLRTLTRLSQAMLSLALGSHGLLVTKALAQAGGGGSSLPLGRPENIPFGFSSVQSTIKTLFNLVIIIAGTIFVILLLVGGIQYLTAAGNEEATGKAKRLIVDSIVGLIIVLAAWAIGTFIIGRLGLTNTTGNIPQE